MTNARGWNWLHCSLGSTGAHNACNTSFCLTVVIGTVYLVASDSREVTHSKIQCPHINNYPCSLEVRVWLSKGFSIPSLLEMVMGIRVPYSITLQLITYYCFGVVLSLDNEVFVLVWFDNDVQASRPTGNSWWHHISYSRHVSAHLDGFCFVDVPYWNHSATAE